MSRDSSRLRLFLLGSIRAEVDDQPIQVDTRKALAVLAYLVTEGRPIARDSLAGLLWPDYPTEAAR
jgi:DNA-binding SARP family transcriptional activator